MLPMGFGRLKELLDEEYIGLRIDRPAGGQDQLYPSMFRRRMDDSMTFSQHPDGREGVRFRRRTLEEMMGVVLDIESEPAEKSRHPVKRLLERWDLGSFQIEDRVMVSRLHGK